MICGHIWSRTLYKRKRFINGYTKLNKTKSNYGIDLNRYIWEKRNIGKILVLNYLSIKMATE